MRTHVALGARRRPGHWEGPFDTPGTSDNVRYVWRRLGGGADGGRFIAEPLAIGIAAARADLSGRTAGGSATSLPYKARVATKNCFIDKERPCDLTCKAAFPVDDAVDPVDCFFIWLAQHVGDGALDFRQMLDGRMPGPPTAGDGEDPGPTPGGFGGVSSN